MEIAKLILEFVKALVWPLVFVIAVFVFRDQIRDAFQRARTIDAMGVNVELAERVEEAQEALEEAQAEARRPVAPETDTPVSAETAAKARQVLKEVLSIMRENRLDFSAASRVTKLHRALTATAHAFGFRQYGPYMARRIAEETNLWGWPALVDTTRLLVRLMPIEDAGRDVELQESQRVSSTDIRLIRGMASQAMETLTTLLGETAYTYDEQAAP
ncbi:hypothetical protein E1264_11720 [Actinomadura sp. KC216]|uniref:hypothetical protein n=1 Tax=Actinomadura sp. KC216 TaxID=2530370 RepID=UPI0010465FFA|nr:hypothetical protein [Actinomadura sp. KC216]TDB88344.1 hypothetical protein E1264_11720 [Actinomadura sp. KC216]